MKYFSLLICAGFSLASNAQTKLNSSDNNRAADPFFGSKVSGEYNLSALLSGVYILQAMEPHGQYKHLPFIKR